MSFMFYVNKREGERERESGRAKSDGGGLMINKMFMSTVKIYIIKFKST